MATESDRTKPDAATRAEDAREAASEHEADRPPTPEEEQAADKQSLDPGVAEAHKEANERGAAAEGEGRIES